MINITDAIELQSDGFPSGFLLFCELWRRTFHMLGKFLLARSSLIIVTLIILYIVSKDLPNINTFCDWLSETVVISIYDSFFRNYISIVLLSFILLSSQSQRLFIQVRGDPILLE